MLHLNFIEKKLCDKVAIVNGYMVRIVILV